ncbi:MAG TPA: hypothetical protein VK612_05360 [Pyrinomonadaceae bacterium]|nr:hypothetical protein [Pyrinomonadaceae bacterium]
MQIFETENGKSVREIRGLGKLSNINKTLGGGFLSGIVLEMGRVPVTKNWKNILVNKNDKEFSIFDFETGELKFDLQHENFNSGWESTKLVFALLGAAAGTPAGFAFLGSASTSQFSENSRYLLIANGNKKPTLWNIESGSLISKFDAGERVFHSGFSPDGTMVATSDFDGITKVWDTETGQLLSTIGSKKERGIVAAWNRSGSKIFIIPSGKGDLKAYAPQSGTRIYAFEGSMPNSTILNKNSTLFLTTPRKNKAILFQIWDLETGKLIASAPRAKKQGVLISLKWSPDSRMIATSDGLKKEVKIWNTKGEYLQTLSSSTLPMRFSDDGKYLATGGVLPNTKLDTGYLWEFPEVESDERLALKIVRR